MILNPKGQNVVFPQYQILFLQSWNHQSSQVYSLLQLVAFCKTSSYDIPKFHLLLCPKIDVLKLSADQTTKLSSTRWIDIKFVKTDKGKTLKAVRLRVALSIDR